MTMLQKYSLCVKVDGGPNVATVTFHMDIYICLLINTAYSESFSSIVENYLIPARTGEITI